MSQNGLENFSAYQKARPSFDLVVADCKGIIGDDARSCKILNAMNLAWPSASLRRAFRRLSRWLFWQTCAMVCLTVASGVHAGDAEPVQRVLIVHSFGSSAPPFTTHSTAFQTTLTQELGKRVDLDEISLDMARYQPSMEEPFVELLLKRFARWHPDLVAPIGSPAGRFVAKFRHRLFPKTTVIYTGKDKRT